MSGPIVTHGHGLDSFNRDETIKMVKKMKVVSFHVLGFKENTFPIKKITSRKEMEKKLDHICKRHRDDKITFIISAGKHVHGHFKITLVWDKYLEEFTDIIAAAYVDANPKNVKFCNDEVQTLLLQVVQDTIDRLD